VKKRFRTMGDPPPKPLVKFEPGMKVRHIRDPYKYTGIILKKTSESDYTGDHIWWVKFNINGVISEIPYAEGDIIPVLNGMEFAIKRHLK